MLREERNENMNDNEIIALFFARKENAISAAAEKYGRYCHTIAHNILSSRPDAEECVNDTYLNAWNSIPPQTPDPLRAYICRIARNCALKRLRANSALKRGSRFEVSLSELEDCIPGSPLDEQLSAGELSAQINAFLAELSRDDRVMFIKRYWFAETITEIADGFGISESNASVRLSRIRGRLRKYLKSKEVYI